MSLIHALALIYKRRMATASFFLLLSHILVNHQPHKSIFFEKPTSIRNHPHELQMLCCTPAISKPVLEFLLAADIA